MIAAKKTINIKTHSPHSKGAEAIPAPVLPSTLEEIKHVDGGWDSCIVTKSKEYGADGQA